MGHVAAADVTRLAQKMEKKKRTRKALQDEIRCQKTVLGLGKGLHLSSSLLCLTETLNQHLGGENVDSDLDNIETDSDNECSDSTIRSPQKKQLRSSKETHTHRR